MLCFENTIKKKVGKLVKRKKERKKLMGNDDVGMDSFLPKKKKKRIVVIDE